MVDSRHLDAAPLEPLPMLGGDLEVLLDDGLGGDPAQTDNQLGPQQRRLPPEPADAGVLLHIQRVPIPGRAALDDVGHIHLRPVQADDLQHIIQQQPRRPYEGDALLVLPLTGALPYQQDLRVPGTVTEHHVEPGLRQGAVPALSAGLLQRLPGIRHPPPPPSCLSPGHHTGGGCPSAAQPNGSGLFAAIVTQNLPPRNEV